MHGPIQDAVPGGDLVRLEDQLWILHRPMGQSVYDFDFERWFPCRRPRGLPLESGNKEKVTLRIGAIDEYASDPVLSWQDIV